MIKAVIFDLDNTLINFTKIKKNSVSAAVNSMRSAGLRLSQAKAEKIMYELYDKYGIEYSKIFQKFISKIRGKVDYKILAAGIVAYRKVQAGILEPYPKVFPLLVKLKEKGLKLAVVSDALRLKAWIRLTELGIGDFFDTVIAYGDVKKRKPSRVPFDKALEKLGVRPSEALMVGDNLTRDIAGAEKIGIKTCFARYGLQRVVIGDYKKDSLKKSRKIIKADYTINKFEDLAKIFGIKL